tara:strand:- start:313 stop:720 length:408 start_codon:yes stop_codon:yes gene_type:complete
MKTLITLIFFFLIHFSSFSQTSDAIPPEVILCDEFTEYVNSKQHIESNFSDGPASEEFRKWLRYINDLISSVEKYGILYGEKIGWREAKAFFKEFKYDIISSKNYFEDFSNNTNEEIGWCYSTMMTSQYYNLTVV